MTPSEIIKHVNNTAGVPLPIVHKTCRSLLDHFYLVYLVRNVEALDCRAVIQFGRYHSEATLCFCSSVAVKVIRCVSQSSEFTIYACLKNGLIT